MAPTPREGRGNSLTLLSAAFDILRCAAEGLKPGVGDAAVAGAAARSAFVMGQCLLVTLTQVCLPMQSLLSEYSQSS